MIVIYILILKIHCVTSIRFRQNTLKVFDLPMRWGGIVGDVVAKNMTKCNKCHTFKKSLFIRKFTRLLTF